MILYLSFQHVPLRINLEVRRYNAYNVEYVPRKEVYLRDFPKNHLAKLKGVGFDFVDYKVYDKLGCFPYERVVVHCLNHYGTDFLHKNAECRDIYNYFQ